MIRTKIYSSYIFEPTYFTKWIMTFIEKNGFELKQINQLSAKLSGGWNQQSQACSIAVMYDDLGKEQVFDNDDELRFEPDLDKNSEEYKKRQSQWGMYY